MIGMPGSYLTEGNVFFGHYKGQEVLKKLRLKSSPQDLKHKGFNLGYSVGLYKHSRWDSTSSQLTILASSPMWMDNDYRGVVMLLTEALNLDSVCLILFFLIYFKCNSRFHLISDKINEYYFSLEYSSHIFRQI